MTIKQYGSLTLDLNTVKQTYDSFGANLLIKLHDGNQITLKQEWHSEFTKDYQEFLWQNRLKVIKDAFDYVFDSNIKVISEGLNCSKSIIDIGYIKFDYLNLVIDKEGVFTGDNFKGKLTEFNIKASEEYLWLRYARQINQVYLDSIIDPVKVANQVLKSRGLNKEWKVLETKDLKLHLVKNNSEEDIIQIWDYSNKSNIRVCNQIKCINYTDYNTPITNSEWVKAIEFALDKYYELQQSTEVNLKLMLGKALKDNGLVAEIVSIFYCEKSLYINVSIPKNKSIQWIKYLDGTIKVFLLTPNNKEAFLSYSTTNVEDWQTIFSDSLAQYKKLTAPKLTKDDIIECLISALEGQYVQSAKYILNDSLVGTIEVKLVGYSSLIWEIEETVKCKNHKDSCGFAVYLGSPKTKEDWITTFKVSLEQLLPVSKEPTLLDLIKQAFPSYQWVENAISGWVGKSSLRWLHVKANDNNISFFQVVSPNFENVIYKIESPYDVFNKESLTSYSNWEQWLEDLIKVKQNLKDLEQSPNLVVKEVKKHSQIPQRKSIWTEEAREKYSLGEDPWL